MPHLLSTEISCPDCGSTSRVDLYFEFTHEDTCPLIESLVSVSLEDREWFEKHPDQTVRTRDTSPAERSEATLFEYPPDQRVTIYCTEAGRYNRVFTPSGVRDVILLSKAS